MVSRRSPDTDVVEEAGARQGPKKGKPRMSGGEGTRVGEGTKGTEEEARKRAQEWRVADGQGYPKVKGGRLGKKEVPSFLPPPSFISFISSLM